ncbi:alpha-amylase family glycosyl hydrolase [Urechidicola croceus]|uniref:Glycosyl hydrolase family 13 catalytic domain-containing protein n=1 Tax=Urechidicola croceus TaxID=1850246 RepID=A0A1D8P706_9FLAO|nr:alpha-amylase family glycosyl hydrolase [Urechidicola croceus]AOW20327.1 hypothetical protein LPB138_06380 [Urechidicola croceus]
MKKLLPIITFLLSIITYGQVTTIPTIPTAGDAITIVFDATGTALENTTGTFYAHTGVTVNGAQWQNVIGSWGDNAVQPSFTHTTGNIYELNITPDVFSFYGVNNSDTITEISMVIRSFNGSAQTSPDIFIPIYADGLNVSITNPTNGDNFNINDMITIEAESSINASLELFVNDISQQTASNTTTIVSSYTFTATGNQTIKVVANQGVETVEEEISVYVSSPTINESLPTGVTNGFNDNGDGTVTFVLLAPNKTDVFLVGGFNNWSLNSDYQLKKDGDYFWTTVSGLDPNTEYAYQYVIDYNIKIADPYAAKVLDPNNDQYIPNSTYPDLMAYPTGETTGIVSTFKINETEYSWQSTSFTRPDKENLVIYEMLLRDFTESDSYQDALTHLDYLEELGVNAIELMPINEFEGNDSWGYNPSFYMALDKTYGTKNDLKEFVDECHLRGIAVLTDVVFNHSFGQSPLLHMYWDSTNNRPAADSPFYNQNHNLVDNTSAHWGYDFNHESSYTVDFFNDVLSYWMTEFNIDGFRFDFTKGLSNTIYSGANNWASAYDGDRIANLKAYADHVWSIDPGNEAYVIFEHLSDNSEETELANYGIMLWGNMNHSFNQNTMGYSSDADVSWLSYQNRGWDSPHIIGYMESHDEERLMVKNLEYGNSNGSYDVKNLGTALDRQEAATAIFYGIPGPKMIWQFGELGYDKSINCESDITDGSCRLDRKPVAWTLGYDSDSDRLELFDVTSKMISLKKQFPSTFNTDNFDLNVSGLVKRINLYDNVGDLDIVIVANFDVTTQSVNPNFPTTGTWYEFFSETMLTVSNPTATLSLQPGEYRLYSQTESLSIVKVDISQDLNIYPNPVNTSFTINKITEKIELYDLSGRMVKKFNQVNNYQTVFDISTLSNGIYFIKFYTSEGTGVKKIIKQ